MARRHGRGGLRTARLLVCIRKVRLELFVAWSGKRQAEGWQSAASLLKKVVCRRYSADGGEMGDGEEVRGLEYLCLEVRVSQLLSIAVVSPVTGAMAMAVECRA